MLVISRKQQEFVQIGEDIVVKIIKTARGSVKIGIAAPEECRVLRGEISEDELSALDEEGEEVSLPRRLRPEHRPVVFSHVTPMKPVSSL